LAAVPARQPIARDSLRRAGVIRQWAQ